jgi:hypothetical protein
MGYRHHLSELGALESCSDFGTKRGELRIRSNDLIEDCGIGEEIRHLLHKLRRIHHRLELYAGLSDQIVRTRVYAHHIWVIRVKPEVREWVDSGHSPKS